MTDKDFVEIIDTLIKQCDFLQKDKNRGINLTREAADSLLKSARLGIWAREKAIPALREYADESSWEDTYHVCDSYSGGTGCLFAGGFKGERDCRGLDIAKEALEALPEGIK